MEGYIEGVYRDQVTLFPEQLEDWNGADYPFRVVAAFVDALELSQAGIERTPPAQAGRPGYRPSVLLKPSIYGYLKRVPSSRRLCSKKLGRVRQEVRQL